MMTIKWGIPICLLMVLLILGFFARADIQHHFMDTDSDFEEKTVFTGGLLDVHFYETKVLSQLPTPRYQWMEVLPSNKDWNAKTIVPIVDYLKGHNEKVVKITGHYLAGESDIRLGGYTNMGEARAGTIKQELMAAGIAAPRILIDFLQIKTTNHQLSFAIECFNDSTTIP